MRLKSSLFVSILLYISNNVICQDSIGKHGIAIMKAIESIAEIQGEDRGSKRSLLLFKKWANMEVPTSEKVFRQY